MSLPINRHRLWQLGVDTGLCTAAWFLAFRLRFDPRIPPYYEPPLHLQPALRYLGYSEGDFPETERAARENLCLPLWAGIAEAQQAEVVAVLRRASTLVQA